MPNPNAIVSPVLGLDPPAEQLRPEALREGRQAPRVALDAGRSLLLDPADSRTPGFAQVLDALRRSGAPAYVELDPDRGTLARLLIPRIDRVQSVTGDVTGDLGVALAHSHALRRLPADSPDRAAFEAMLREATGTDRLLVVTTDEAGDIIDIRLPGPGWTLPRLPDLPPPRPWSWEAWFRDWLRRVWLWPWWPWWWFGCISAARAQQVFNDMQATGCAPLSVPVPCIPFLYPDDGCFARAHEMCRLMQAMGLRPRKVWIRGTLRTPTRNHPACFVRWGWHVAPTLCVRDASFWLRRTMVIDPSLFTTPVTPDTWKGVQGDAAALLDHTSAEPYFHVWGDVFDPGYVETNADLARYRNLLLLRALNIGPPPYANCP